MMSSITGVPTLALLREVPTSRPMDLDKLMEFEAFCGRAEGKSEKTIELKLLAIRRLRAFLEAEGRSTDASQVTPDDVRRFIVHLQQCRRFQDHPYAHVQDDALSDVSVHGYLRSLRAAWNGWVREGLVDVSPFTRLTLPRPTERQKPVLSDDHLDTLFAAIDTSSPQGYRDLTLLSVIFDTGLRLSEATNARVADLDLKGGHLRVMGKGRRERTVPIALTTRKLLWKYLRQHRPEPMLPQDDFLFLTFDGRRLTKNRVESILRKYAAKAGVNGPACTPHGLRRAFCVGWLRAGGGLFQLARVTGHRDLEVLRSYANLDQSDVDAAHRQFSPVDNLRARGKLAPRKRRRDGSGTRRRRGAEEEPS